MSYASIILVIILAYLLGSIPFGLLVTKLAGLGDIRQIGSGNIGATNVLRTGRKSLAVLTLILDCGKGAVAVLVAHKLYALIFDENIFDQRVQDWTYVAGFTAFIGHLFPIWLKFKGGKGVATAVGVITALCWPIGLGAMLLWTAIIAISRYSSLAALVTLGLVPFVCLGFEFTHAACLAFAIFGFIIFKHKANIRRLLKGTEPKIGEDPSCNDEN